MSFNLEIISPQKIFFNDEIDLCILPGVEGDFGILKNHMPFLTTLRIGIAYVYKNKKLIETFLINGGVLEVNENKCTLLTEDIIKSDDFRKEDNDSEVEKENWVGYKDLSLGNLVIMYSKINIRDEIFEILEITNPQMMDYTTGEEVIEVMG